MTHYLCVSVTFLDPLFHGQADQGEPEWPPSPWRVFQALVAGAYTGCRKTELPESKAEAFRYMERLPPPEIVAPHARLAASYTLFVPNNDSDKKFDRHDRLTTKLVQPYRLLDGQTVHYLWALSDSAVSSSSCWDLWKLICRSARQILALGWGIDMVVADARILTAEEASRLSGHRWLPSPSPMLHHRRRVPKSGSFDDLVRAYQSFVHSVQTKRFRPPDKPRVFDVVTYRRICEVPPRPYAAFDLCNSKGKWRPFPQTHIVYVAAMLRHRACEEAKHDTHQFEGGPEVYVAGHVPNSKITPPRFSYLPLPTIRPGGYADGLIRRVLIAEPYGSHGRHAHWAQMRLTNKQLVNTDRQRCAILSRPHPRDPVYSLYVEPSRAWATVTPVALPGYDDGKQTKAELLFLKAVWQAGLPLEAVEEFTLRKAPFWPGSHHPALYRRPQEYLKRCPLWHVHVRFKEEIPGPLAIGVGRHCGLGLFAHWNE